MAYGLPERGQPNWDDDLNNSVEALRLTAETAASDASTARSTAIEARFTAQAAAASQAVGNGDAALANLIETGDATTAALSASIARRVEPFVLTLNPDGSVATETVGGLVTTYAYNADGSLHTSTRDGVTVTFAYDASGNMTGAS